MQRYLDDNWKEKVISEIEIVGAFLWVEPKESVERGIGYMWKTLKH